MKNLKTTSKVLVLGTVTGVILVGSLTSCNRQMVDFNKSFNVAIEKNDESVSVMGIDGYKDYVGSMVQITTDSGLIILGSTNQMQLVKSTSENSISSYVSFLTDDEKKVTYVDDINYDSDLWNKKVINLNYEYNKAVILSNDTAMIVNLNNWRSYEDDDKIQIKLEDSTCILTNADKIKLVNDKHAEEGSLEKYAASLVGGKDKVLVYEENSKNKQKVKSK